MVVGLGIGDEVGQVGQDGVRGRLGGQGYDLVHGQVLLALPEFLLPGDVDAGPAVGPEVLGEQLNLTGEVVVHLRVDRPVHQVVRGDGLVELADVGGADAEHRAPEGGRTEVHEAVDYLVGKRDARVGGAVPGEGRLVAVGIIPLLAVVGLPRPAAVAHILGILDPGEDAVVGGRAPQLLGQCADIGLVADPCHHVGCLLVGISLHSEMV